MVMGGAAGAGPDAEALWFLMHHSDDPRKLSPALTCYCDDSGSHDEANVAVVGAILMNKPRSIEFHCDWQKILKEFRVKSIHMQDFVRPYERYSAMRIPPARVDRPGGTGESGR